MCRARACFGNRVLGLVGVEVLLNLLLGRLRHATGNLALRERKIGDLSLFRHARRITREFFLKNAARSPSDGLIVFRKSFRGDDRIVKLDLDALLSISFADVLIAD